VTPGADVICRRSLPSTRIVQSCQSEASASLRSKTICVPSGDQDGHPFAKPSVVSCRSPDPSAFATKSAALRTNAIRVASGDQEGSLAAAPIVCGLLPSTPITPTSLLLA
jgi:hypothetical protein